jgi:hypothetical protein
MVRQRRISPAAGRLAVAGGTTRAVARELDRSHVLVSLMLSGKTPAHPELESAIATVIADVGEAAEIMALIPPRPEAGPA